MKKEKKITYENLLFLQEEMLLRAEDDLVATLGHLEDTFAEDIETGAKKIFSDLEIVRKALGLIRWEKENLLTILKNSYAFDYEGTILLPDREIHLLRELLEVGKSKASLRSIVIEVGQAMLSNSLLTLTPAKKDGVVEVGEKFKIKLPDGREFVTELTSPGNRLSERGAIRHFYETCRVHVGDKVVLEETKSGEWILRKFQPEKDEMDLDFLSKDEGGNNE
jgi:hypothetical protein